MIAGGSARIVRPCKDSERPCKDSKRPCKDSEKPCKVVSYIQVCGMGLVSRVAEAQCVSVTKQVNSEHGARSGSRH